jgi:hypothetical protein
MEYYSVTRNNDIGFEGKWKQLEDIMLSQVNQDQKHKRHVLSHTWKIDPKIKIYTKTNIIYNSVVEHVCNSVTTLWNLGKLRKEE